MTDVKISALPSATTPLTGTEILPIVQGGTTDQVSVANLTAGRAVSAASLTLTTTPLGVASGGTGLTSLTAGYIPYGNGTSAFSSSSNLFWDSANSRLGIGTTSPAYSLDVNGAINCQNFNLTGGGYPTQNFYPTSGTTNQRAFRYVAGGGNFSFISIDDSGTQVNYPLTIAWNGTTSFGGNVGIGTTTPGTKLNIYTGSATATQVRAQNTNGYADFGPIADGTIYGPYASPAASTSLLIGTSNSNPVLFYSNGSERARIDSSGNVLVTGSGGLGYGTGSGGAVTQATSRTTGVTLNKTNGAITLFSAAGSTTPATFTVTNSTVAATDVIYVSQKSGSNLYVILVTAVAAGSFNITQYTTGGTTSEAPVFNFAIIKAVTA